ncbi:spermidine/putrescine ABC transporter substrate-binding protein [Thermomicrobium sp. 4228-Ro]|uniref:polyamine ABC transporter substrate-binding protein n=1 Tax=Thermomicrobium sp. 4228-Ro TaxID=2993937 RepID=UPI0022493C6D|nr:spermidine/putrescine ABC transporter substrate-binding protein [Thermomicrobium sp. 4228-Ro]MCX2727275.1 spermidine/putrescine ABC transporter substrate-binding protein [Thermomicrobium sp. 4228-Ro]
MTSTLELPPYIDRSRLESELFVFNWGDYIDPDVLADFERLTSVKVTIDTYETNEQAIAKLQQGGLGYDIVVPTDYAVQIAIGLGLLQELDRSVIRAIEHLDPNNLNGPFDPGNRYSVPYFWGTSGYAYDTAVLGDGLTSWRALFEPAEAARGKLVMHGYYRETIAAALLWLGYPLNETSDEALQRALAVLKAQKPYVLSYTSENNDELLVAGEAVIAHCWTGQAILAKREKPTIRYVIPAEGCAVWQDNLCVVKDAPHPYAAMVFIDFLCWPEIAARNATYVGYASPNRTARERGLLDPDLVDDPAIYLDDTTWRRLQWFRDLGPDYVKYDRIWTELQAG